ncbi:MAG: MFS transporter [Ruminococcaceae bacterium]|nr:MFS transporter [Oscillospiraceae bacterium]
MKLNAKHTMGASYIGYTTQALAINYAPLLFITFENSYGISISKISLLIAISFVTQLLVDAFEAKFSSRFDTRISIIAGHICSALGLVSYAILPEILPDAFVGLVIATVLGGIGGGVIEVLISPIVEACPTKNKAKAMSLLHSFYCWGTALTILISSLFFSFVGIERWRSLTCLWALIPMAGAVMFSVVPIYKLEADTKDQEYLPKKNLSRSPLFWAFVAMMFCAGAAEMAMIQWASSFAEAVLGIDKTAGDLLGPFAFAIFMGVTRLAYAFMSKKIKLAAFFMVSAALCVISYLLTALSPYPLLSLVGCTLCGISVAVMWPGTYSLATENITFGGVRMFALLALAGDVGCVVGPSVAGFIADAFGNDLRISFIVSALFPLAILLLIPFILSYTKRQNTRN